MYMIYEYGIDFLLIALSIFLGLFKIALRRNTAYMGALVEGV